MLWQRLIPNGKTQKSSRLSRSSDYAEFGHFTFIVTQRTTKKCTKIYNARAQLCFSHEVFCLFGDRRSCYRHRPPFFAENGFRFFISFVHLIQFHD